MNRLRYETSPYLLQHARNPVDWYAWKAEAFERAQTEDKPMLVSIGYSTCHWCHVMERESFEDEETAAYMNENFINIKVDREERPDIDHIYMEACQAFSGQGGWPLNCFLMPDGRPFYAGTYYPPGPAYNRPSWRQLLENIVHAFRNKRDLVEKQADQLTSIIERSDQVFFRENVAWSEAGMPAFTREGQDRIYRHLQEQFDQVHGGFGGAPKFPGAMSLEYLLAYDHFFGEPAARRHVGLSLDRMARGGIFDQLGGGFARYATDRAWLVPHFEKMLYDNALLVRLLAAAWQATGSSLYRDAIEATLSFTDREMTSPEGGFYSALDADSEGEEGKFYVWQKKEIEEVLGDEAEWVCAYFGVSEEGNWEGKNILWCPEPAEPFAASRGMQSDVFRSRLDKARALLLDRRAQRVRPGLDDKILLGWNALQASAYAKAYEALGHESYRQAAVRNLDFLLTHLRQPGGPAFYHTYKEGAVQYDAFLDDYAFLIDALLDVYSITFEDRFLDQAGEITEWVRASFFDPGTGLFFYTSADQWDVILRKRELYDSATPSGNSTMAHNLIRLGILLGRPDYREQAAAMVSAMRESIEKYSSSFSRWALAMLRLTAPDYEIAVVGHGAGAVARALYSHYLPYKAIMASEQTDERYPLLAGKAGDGPALIYICRQYSCLRPVADPGEAIRMLMPEKW